jgi:hypothetical protein
MDKCPNVKEVPGICDGLPVFCRGCTESVNRCTQLMSESRDEARDEVRSLKLQNSELKKALREAVGLIEGRPNPYCGTVETWKALFTDKPEKD